MIFCYTPRSQFTRIYLVVPAGKQPWDYDQDIAWAEIKKSCLCIEPGDERNFYDPDTSEEADERATWFADWNDEKCWDVKGSIAIDNHY